MFISRYMAGHSRYTECLVMVETVIFTDVTAPTTVKCGKMLISKTTEVDNCIKSDHAMKPT